MAESYQFGLQKWNQRDKSLRCPQCGKGHGCYKEYVNLETGEAVDPDNHLCGKCDHENSCGYHLTPAEWYKLNPTERKAFSGKVKKEQRTFETILIEPGMVGAFYRHTKAASNTFIEWLKSLPWEDHQRQCIDIITQFYAIGTTKDGRVIWWQIDEKRKVRTGKIMAYDQTGHRMKDAEGNSIGFGWVHAKLKPCPKGPRICKDCHVRDKCPYPEDTHQLSQCLFGLHLLPACPDAEIHLVESEKTAILMSILDPDAMQRHLWMATGGLQNLNEAVLFPLRGRTIVCYPDTNGIEKWKAKTKGMHNVKVSTYWMQQLTDQDPKGADIADVMVRKIMEAPQPTPPSEIPSEPQLTLFEQLQQLPWFNKIVKRLGLTQE